ncbi:Uu.00g027910.m01.CDS01 [Anthostomella pinea]|uniref:Uu.00g027910.m01.CDS01 n=1 Tax=Anthostomella pinea TaxID=933095 RepID=A0AAI8YCV9_9PEZI|nr:Uu.00g027910.m01.CDS01 [Anthostomella pinea]
MHPSLLLALPALAAGMPSALSRRATSAEPTSTYCGAPNAYEVISGTPWIVFSMNYNYQDISGSCCTGYYDVSGSGDVQTIHWSSIWDIDPDVDANVVKGYSFVGLTQNLETRLSDIASIPSTYNWSVDNSTAYKGNVVYDFMTSDTQGDSTSSAAQELMLWLHYEGGQTPLGYNDGVVATIDNLYGKDGWQLYQGLNTGTGIMVSSLLAPAADQFDGVFEGNVRDWLLALVDQGLFAETTYVNVGNAGMEPFWGTVTFDSTLGLRIDV